MLPPMNEVDALRARLIKATRIFEAGLDRLPLGEALTLGIDDATKIKIKEFFNTKEKLFILARQKIQTVNYDKLEKLDILFRSFAVGLTRLETIYANRGVIKYSDIDFYAPVRDFLDYKERAPLRQTIDAAELALAKYKYTVAIIIAMIAGLWAIITWR